MWNWGRGLLRRGEMPSREELERKLAEVNGDISKLNREEMEAYHKYGRENANAQRRIHNNRARRANEEAMRVAARQANNNQAKYEQLINRLVESGGQAYSQFSHDERHLLDSKSPGRDFIGYTKGEDPRALESNKNSPFYTPPSKPFNFELERDGSVRQMNANHMNIRPLPVNPNNMAFMHQPYAHASAGGKAGKQVTGRKSPYSRPTMRGGSGFSFTALFSKKSGKSTKRKSSAKKSKRTQKRC